MLEKISRETPDLTQENIDKLLELFPQVATEIEDTASAQHSTAQA